MTASETPIINGSTVDATLIGSTDDPVVDSKAECEGRTEETIPRTSPDPDPQRMDDDPLQADGGLKDDEPAPLEATEQSPVNGSATEDDSVAPTAG